MSGGCLKEVLVGSPSSGEQTERVSYMDSDLNQEAIENYCRKYGVFPTPESLEEYIRTGEEARDFIRKRDAFSA